MRTLSLNQQHYDFGLHLSEAPADSSLINLIYLGHCVGSWKHETVRVDDIRDRADEVMRLGK